MNITNKIIREYFGHDNIRCKIVIKKNGDILRNNTYIGDIKTISDIIKHAYNSFVIKDMMGMYLTSEHVSHWSYGKEYACLFEKLPEYLLFYESEIVLFNENEYWQEHADGPIAV